MVGLVLCIVMIGVVAWLMVPAREPVPATAGCVPDPEALARVAEQLASEAAPRTHEGHDEQRRGRERVAAGGGEPLWARFETDEEPIQVPVVDLSADGLAVELHGALVLPETGHRVTFAVGHDETPLVYLEALVRHQEDFSDGWQRLGLDLAGATRDALDAVAVLVDALAQRKDRGAA